MCRWIAYIGPEIYLDTLVTKPSHSLVAQSLHAQEYFKSDGSIWSTNGDGFGIGWYTDLKEPGLFKGAEPVWNNENLHELCSHTKSCIFMAHIRATTTGAVQRSNSHPFKYKNFLFQHNGHIHDFEIFRRELQLDIAPELYNEIKGTKDSETFFLLALTYGFKDTPKKAVEKALKRVERSFLERNLPIQINFSCVFSDGHKLYTVRYSKGEKVSTLYYATDHASPSNVEKNSKENLVGTTVVSEPLDCRKEYWKEIPENSFATIYNGEVLLEEIFL